MQGRVAAAGSGRVPDGTVPRLGIAASAHTRRPSAPTRPVEQVPTNGARSDAAGVVVRSSLPRNSCARRTAATLAHVRHQPADILGGSPADMRSLPACWASTSGPCLVVPRYHGGCILMRTHPPRSNCSEAPATVSHRLVCAGLTRGASGLCDRYWRNFQRKAGELIVTPGTPNCWQVQVPANDPASEKERWCGRPMPVPRQRAAISDAGHAGAQGVPAAAAGDGQEVHSAQSRPSSRAWERCLCHRCQQVRKWSGWRLTALWMLHNGQVRARVLSFPPAASKGWSEWSEKGTLETSTGMDAATAP
jgi:hypothetical protein